MNDTEDYINIMLDDKQNQLLQMGMMLSTATLMLNIGYCAVEALSMNVRVQLFNIDAQQGTPIFLWTAGSCTIGSILLYILAICFYKYKGYI